VTGGVDAELVDRVVSAARRERLRRDLLLLAVGLSLVAAIGAPLMLLSTHGARPAYVADGRPTPGNAGLDRSPDPAEIRAAARRFLDRSAHRAGIRFGRVQVGADRAELRVEVRCGPRCRFGETLVLVRGPAGWRVTGTTGHRRSS
jgi:hypothetical protein